MTGEGLRVYDGSNVSANTDLRVCGNRTISARGTLIHTTSGTDSRKWLQSGSAEAGSPASADYLIRRDGYQFGLTPQGRYAYHAGRSQYTLDRTYYNAEVSQVLLGIELECLDTESPTFEQLDSLSQLIVTLAPIWAWRWPFIILGHYAVARPLGRRSDPVNFDWGWLFGRLYVRAEEAEIPGM